MQTLLLKSAPGKVNMLIAPAYTVLKCPSSITDSSISKTIPENTRPATVLETIVATDGNGDDLIFTLSRADSSNAEDYFYIDQNGNNATLRVRQLLTSDRPTLVYRMRITVSDGVNTVSIPTQSMTTFPFFYN